MFTLNKQMDIEQDFAKTKSSLRTLPLVGSFKAYFQQVKNAQELNKKVCGDCYDYSHDGYVLVDELGRLMNGDYLSNQFPKFVEKRGLRRMRFHDLRHSCARLLVAKNVSMKQVQLWLGHSTFSTTADIYANLNANAMYESANCIANLLTAPSAKESEKREKGS